MLGVLSRLGQNERHCSLDSRPARQPPAAFPGLLAQARATSKRLACRGVAAADCFRWQYACCAAAGTAHGFHTAQTEHPHPAPSMSKLGAMRLQSSTLPLVSPHTLHQQQHKLCTACGASFGFDFDSLERKEVLGAVWTARLAQVHTRACQARHI